jgi:hypothetical protein
MPSACTGTMPGCSSAPVITASRSNAATAAGAGTSRSVLTATSRQSERWRAACTYAPSPIAVRQIRVPQIARCSVPLLRRRSSANARQSRACRCARRRFGRESRIRRQPRRGLGEPRLRQR